MKNLALILIATASFLVAESDDLNLPFQEGQKELAKSENLIEKVLEEAQFSENFSAIELNNELSDEHLEQIEEKEIALSENPEIEAQNSLEGVIEKETASILTESQVDEIVSEERVSPSQVDLRELLEKPMVTSAPTVVIKEETTFQELEMSIADRQKIANILNTMADNNVFSLLFEKKRLEKLGHEIKHVHPIRFLGAVFSDPRLVYCMKRIRRSGFKWDGFVDGFSQRFAQEIRDKNINKYVPSFAAYLHVPEADVQAYVNYNDFEGLLIYLLENAKQ